jgi:AraC family transcriptional regulator
MNADTLPQRPVQAATEARAPGCAEPGLGVRDTATAGLSVDPSGRVFREHVNVAPVRYLRGTRVRRSRFLLQHTSLQIREVAGQVIFHDALCFSRVFRKPAGVSPGAYHRDARTLPERGGTR